MHLSERTPSESHRSPACWAGEGRQTPSVRLGRTPRGSLTKVRLKSLDAEKGYLALTSDGVPWFLGHRHLDFIAFGDTPLRLPSGTHRFQHRCSSTSGETVELRFPLWTGWHGCIWDTRVKMLSSTDIAPVAHRHFTGMWSVPNPPPRTIMTPEGQLSPWENILFPLGIGHFKSRTNFWDKPPFSWGSSREHGLFPEGTTEEIHSEGTVH